MLSETERSRLVDENLAYVRALAAQIKEQLPAEIEYEELVAYGTQGLLEAAQRFDPRGGATFSTYAYYRIRGAIFDGLRQMGWLPRAAYRHRNEEKASSYLAAIADRDGAESQAGMEINLEAEVQSLSDALAGVATIFVTSLAATDREFAHDGPGPDQKLDEVRQERRVRDALATLPDKERRLLELHYFGQKSLQEAGAELGLSKSWASRLHARAVDLLRAALERAERAAGRAPAAK